MINGMPVTFHVPFEYEDTLKKIANNELIGQTALKRKFEDSEDVVALLHEIIERSMEQACKVGFTLATGKRIA